MINMSLRILKVCSFALALSFFLIVSRTQSLAGSASGADPDTASVHDGQYDFDFDFGTRNAKLGLLGWVLIKEAYRHQAKVQAIALLLWTESRLAQK